MTRIKATVDGPVEMSDAEWEELQAVQAAAAVEIAAAEMRRERDRLLEASDTKSGALWTDVWFSKSESWRAAWSAYRDALRNVPQNYPDPATVVWPAEPGAEE